MIVRRHHTIVVGVILFLFCYYLPNKEDINDDLIKQLPELKKEIMALRSQFNGFKRDFEFKNDNDKSVLPDPNYEMEDEEEEYEEQEQEQEQEQAPHRQETSNEYLRDVINGRLVTTSRVPVKIIILVGSTARSGTSFMGELLSQCDKKLYLFEPELYVRMTSKEMVNEENGVSILRDMIYCQLSMKFTDWLRTRSSASNIFRHDHTRARCKDWKVCLENQKLTEVCRGEHLRILKVIRIRMSWLRPLLDDPALDIKIIHLVRDPRGSLFSMQIHNLHRLEPEYYCPLIEDDIDETPKLMKEYPGKVFGFTYEQICLDPFGKATEIWRFLEGDQSAELSPKWKEYIEIHMTPKAKSGKFVYGTVRNTTEQYQDWRDKITEEALITIEPHCEGVLKKLGYNAFGSIDNARDIKNYPYFAH